MLDYAIDVVTKMSQMVKGSFSFKGQLENAQLQLLDLAEKYTFLLTPTHSAQRGGKPTFSGVCLHAHALWKPCILYYLFSFCCCL